MNEHVRGLYRLIFGLRQQPAARILSSFRTGFDSARRLAGAIRHKGGATARSALRRIRSRTPRVRIGEGPQSLPTPGKVELVQAGIDGIYVVHCKALTDRKKYLVVALRVSGMDAEWVEVMDWDEVPSRLIRERVTQDALTPQEVSLFLKHERIFRNVIERGQRSALILEDDVVLPADFCARFAESVRHIPLEYDLIFMGESCDMHVTLERNPFFGMATRSRSTCAYLVTNRCCRTILDEPDSINLPIDLHIDRIIGEKLLKVYWHEPPLIRQGSELGEYHHSLGIKWRENPDFADLKRSHGNVSDRQHPRMPPHLCYRVGHVKQMLKQFRSLVGVVQAARTLPRDLRVIRWKLRRRRQVSDYLATHQLRKMQIGCGTNVLSGWLNTDHSPWNDSVAFLDAAAPFPLPAGSMDYVFSEHMIEHIEYAQGQAMLRECSRVLRPGGVIRIATPNLCNIVSLLTQPEGVAQQQYVREATDKYVPQSRRYRPGLVINNFFRGFGHRFVYDPLTLREALVDAGFEQIRMLESGVSSHRELANLESHGAMAGEAINRFETMVFEAVKP